MTLKKIQEHTTRCKYDVNTTEKMVKSSFGEKVLAKIESNNDNTKMVSIDLFSGASEEEFLVSYPR